MDGMGTDVLRWLGVMVVLLLLLTAYGLGGVVGLGSLQIYSPEN